MNEIFTDARTYINQTNKHYDVVLVDVYGDASIPFSLITKEYGQALSNILAPGGVVIANVIAGMDDSCRDVFAAVDAAYRVGLPYAQYSNESGKLETRANHVVLYSSTQLPAIDGMKRLPNFGVTAFSDNYSPAERLYYQCQLDSNRA